MEICHHWVLGDNDPRPKWFNGYKLSLLPSPSVSIHVEGGMVDRSLSSIGNAKVGGNN